MRLKRPISLPVTLAVIMIVLVIVLTVGWIWITVQGVLLEDSSAGFYWTFLALGTTFLGVILAGVIIYLVLSIKAINLSQRQANFIDSVTHELKSPIASLKLYLQTLNRRQISDEEKGKFYSTMLEDVERLDHLINHLLDAGRLDKEREDAEIETIQLDRLLQGCAQSITLLYRVPAEVVKMKLQPCTIRSYRGDLDILFRNLIDNAIKYSGNQPEVEVELKVDSQNQAVVKITDNGPGIPPKMRRKIFGRLCQAGIRTTKRKTRDWLGLYIVRTLVSRLKGKVQVLDGPNGQGTSFVVSLPDVTVSEETETEMTTGEEPTMIEEKLAMNQSLKTPTETHILVVEDEEHLAAGIRYNLEAKATM